MLRFEDVAAFEHGDVPIIVSSHHDGFETRMHGNELAVVRQVENDDGINCLARVTADMMLRIHFVRPFFFSYKIRKDRSTVEMFEKYAQKVMEVSAKCLSVWGKCAVVDLHRFYKHPELPEEIKENYDIWFGTDHRKTVFGEFDRNLAAALKQTYRACFTQAIKIYVPDENGKEWERFGATGKNTLILTKCLGDAFFGARFSAVQMEFYKDMILEGVPMAKLAIALANAIVKSI